MSPDRLQLPPEGVSLEVLYVEMKHLLAAMMEMKESCRDRKKACGEDVSCLFERIRELEKAKPFNPSWIYAMGVMVLAGVELFRLLHWLK